MIKNVKKISSPCFDDIDDPLIHMFQQSIICALKDQGTITADQYLILIQELQKKSSVSQKKYD